MTAKELGYQTSYLITNMASSEKQKTSPNEEQIDDEDDHLNPGNRELVSQFTTHSPEGAGHEQVLPDLPSLDHLQHLQGEDRMVSPHLSHDTDIRDNTLDESRNTIDRGQGQQKSEATSTPLFPREPYSIGQNLAMPPPVNPELGATKTPKPPPQLMRISHTPQSVQKPKANLYSKMAAEENTTDTQADPSTNENQSWCRTQNGMNEMVATSPAALIR